MCLCVNNLTCCRCEIYLLDCVCIANNLCLPEKPLVIGLELWPVFKYYFNFFLHKYLETKSDLRLKVISP